jgi:predicted metal-binding membrane protein
MRLTSQQNLLLMSLGGLVVLAWLALWWLEQSPWASLLHAHAGAHHAHGALHATGIAAVSLFLAGWVLMTIAMMLPATFPLVVVVQRLVSNRSDATLLVGLMLTGYVTAWLAFGLLAWGLNVTLNSGLEHAPGWIAGAVLLIVAGAFQFSSLKYRCLDRCRAPLSFVLNRWQGTRPRSEALRLGLDHGVFCVGCCWALMLLMFAVSTASLLWMLVLGALMAIEKNASWGRRLSMPLGVALIALGVAAVAYHLG